MNKKRKKSKSENSTKALKRGIYTYIMNMGQIRSSLLSQSIWKNNLKEA